MRVSYRSTHKLNFFSGRLYHALQWIQKNYEFLAFSSQFCPDVRFFINSIAAAATEIEYLWEVFQRLMYGVSSFS